VINLKKEQVFDWIQKIVGGLLILSYLLALYAVIRINLIPVKYLLFIIPITAIVIGALAYTQLKKKLSAGKTIAVTTLSLLTIIVSVYVFLAGNATLSFLNGLQETGDSYEQYSIIAKKDAHITLGTNKATGLISTDTNTDAVKTEVDKLSKTTYKSYGELASTTVALGNKDITTAAVKTSYVDLLQDNNVTFYKSIETLATFKVKVKKAADTTQADTTKPFIMYISGIDTYGDISTVSRSDVNILVVVNPVTHKILLVNTPRDYYVQLHGTTGIKDKLTHAGIYGVDMSESTLEDLYGVKIDYYMRVNFASLMNIVDVLGGVNVYSDYAFTAGGYSYTTGYQQMDGKKALAFSRERHAFEDGDRQRGKDQQRVIEAIIRKLSSPETLVNYQKILTSVNGAFQTNASTDTITSLMQQQMNSLRAWQTESISVDGTGATAATYSMGDLPLYVMIPDEASVATAKLRIQQNQQ
jgi:LCP family protein required for cell wall assembly